jgi:hypothetical protein
MTVSLMDGPGSNMKIDCAVKPGIVLAVKNEKRQEVYLSALGSSAAITSVERLGEIPELLRKSPYSGILIDINLKVKATYMEKVRISDSLNTMPSATLNCKAGQEEIKLLMADTRYGTARTLDEFINLCATFQPEVIYHEEQNALHLNALLSRSPDFGADAEHTFTMNISESGCFLFTADKTGFESQDTIWIDFVGLAQRNPVKGKVCWKCEWGVSNSVPGIYVSFESILESQHKEIKCLLA